MKIPKRLAVIAFTSPAYWYGSALAVQKGNPKNIHTWADFAGHTIGTVRGSINQHLLEPRKDLAELKLYTSNEAEFSDLLAGRIDGAMEDGLKIGEFIKQHPTAGLEFASGYEPQSVEYGYARYAMRKEDVDLNHAISRALEEMRGDGRSAENSFEQADFRPAIFGSTPSSRKTSERSYREGFAGRSQSAPAAYAVRMVSGWASATSFSRARRPTCSGCRPKR